MTALRAERTILADPTSAALLLAKPAALDLWPGLRRSRRAGGRVRARLALPDGGDMDLEIRALPPARTPAGYVIRFSVIPISLAGPAGEPAVGALTLRPVGRLTRAVLELAGLAPGLAQDAAGFLANLAGAAEERSRAA